MSFRRKPKGPEPTHPSGRIRPAVLATLAVAAALLFGSAALIVRRSTQPVEAVAGPWLLRETHREATGQQRATRVAFDEAGERLAVLCPRYNRILTYRVDDQAELSAPTVIPVEGRPVALAVIGANVAVLQRPVNDAKHLGPGWLDVFGFDGGRVGVRAEAGYYPDDLAATPDGTHLVVLASGRGEGDATKHAPELTVHETSALLGDTPSTPVGRVAFGDADDPERLTLSRTGDRALTTLAHTREAVALDLADLREPKTAGRLDLRSVQEPYVSRSEDGDWIVVPACDEHQALALSARPVPGPSPDSAAYLVVSRPEDSMLDLVQVEPTALLGRFPVLGPLNLGGAEPSALAFCERRRLLAATTKPGAVHIIRLESRVDDAFPPPARVAASR